MQPMFEKSASIAGIVGALAFIAFLLANWRAVWEGSLAIYVGVPVLTRLRLRPTRRVALGAC